MVIPDCFFFHACFCVLLHLKMLRNFQFLLFKADVENKINEGIKEGWLGGDEMDKEIRTILWELNSPLAKVMP